MNRHNPTPEEEARWYGEGAEYDAHVALNEQMLQALDTRGTTSDALLDDALARADRISFPMPAVLSRLVKIGKTLETGRHRDAVSLYTTVLGIIARKGDRLPNELIETVYSMSMFAMAALTALPEASLAQMRRFIELIGRDLHRLGHTTPALPVLHAMYASEIGDRRAFDHWFQEWRLAGPFKASTAGAELNLQATYLGIFDPAAALRLIDGDAPRLQLDEDDAIAAESTAAGLLPLLGHREEGCRRALDLFHRFGEKSVLEHGDAASLLRALEPQPHLTGPAYARLREGLASVAPDGIPNLDDLAGVARYLWLRDPASPEGHAFAQQARSLAAAYDRRNGNGFQSFDLERRTLERHGLPARR